MRKWIVAIAVLAALAGAGAWNLSGVYAQEAAAPAAAPVFPGPVMETERFMKKFADPLVENLKTLLAQEPATPRDWRKVEDEAGSGAEVAVLVGIRVGEHESKPEWQEMTKAMYDASVALTASAAKKDYADTKAKYEALVQSCNACHQKIDPDTLPVIEP